MLNERPTHVAWLVLSLMLLLVLPVGADDEPNPLDKELAKARFLEKTKGNHADALEQYENLIALAADDSAIRGHALLGKARCLVALERPAEAQETWKAILADGDLGLRIHEEAKNRLDAELAKRAVQDIDAQRKQAQREIERQRREEASRFLEQAQRAFEDGRLEDARQHCLVAKQMLPNNPEADRLLDRINEAMPDRGNLLTQLLRFIDTTHKQGARRVEQDVKRLTQQGMNLYKASDLPKAARTFREAIQKVDESDFLMDLAADRESALVWLKRTLEDGEARGLDLGDEPPYPDLTRSEAGWRRRFYDLLSEIFNARTEEEDPLIIYDARPAIVSTDAREAVLTAGAFPTGIAATRGDGNLTRSWWAERWIRRNVGTGWTVGRGSRSRPRVLDRFGDILVVQNNRAAHRRVQEILAGFPEVASPVLVDVAVVAATTQGGTRLAAHLELRATARESGLDLAVSNRLFQESVKAVPAFEGLQMLGSLRVAVGGSATTKIRVTQRAEDHPVYDGLPNPPLQLTDEESRYGLDLDLYAENLTRAPGAPRGALGVVARTRVPRGSIVVNKEGTRGNYARVARPMAEQTVEAFRILNHTGTLVVHGISNPFPETARAYPGLIVLLGIRPGDDGTGRIPMADPPRHRPGPSAVPTGPEEREYRLGPLAAEVLDDVLVEGWPMRPMMEPVPPAAARKARERYLAGQLGGTWSRLAEPGQPTAVTVRGDVATASLTGDGHRKLEAAVQRLRGADTALYEVDVLATEVSEETLAQWMLQEGITAFTPGTYLVTSTRARRQLDERMRTESRSGGLYTLQSRLLARATQRVATHNLHVQRIVEDLRFWRHKDGTMRYIPVQGVAEEGVLVLVRPEFDQQGRRLVIVESLAAKLRALERVRLPDLELPEAQVTIPRYHPVQSRKAAAPLGDDEAVVLTLPSPESAGRVVVVKVHVRRAQ